MWVPVNDVASTLTEMSLADTDAYPIYHIDSPVGQPWDKMIRVLDDTLDIPHGNVVPFKEWV